MIVHNLLGQDTAIALSREQFGVLEAVIDTAITSNPEIKNVLVERLNAAVGKMDLNK